MFDRYEKAQWQKIKEARYMIVDALTRADDGMSEERFDMDRFGYAYIQLRRAEREMQAILELMMKMRCRRLDAEEKPRDVPLET